MPQPPAAQIARQAAAALRSLCLATRCLAALCLAGPFTGAQAQAAAPPGIVRADIPAPPGENHGAAIAQLPSGALLACWYSGKHEEDRSVRILCARSQTDGAAWSAPWTAVAPGDRAIGAAAPAKSLGNVTLTVTPDGRVWMVHGVIQSRPLPIIGETCRNWACGRIDARVSADAGRTWSRATRLVDLEGALPRAELKPLPGPGAYVLPFYEETAQRSSIAAVSLAGSRAGVLWRRPLEGYRLIQPALAPVSATRFRVFFRDQRRQGVYAAWFDAGKGVWSEVTRTNLPNPAAAVDVFADAAGRFVLIYNPSAQTRDVLALARSADGTHFTPGCELSTPADAPAAYPSVIRGRDGAWRAVFSATGKGRIRFVRFDSVWLAKCFG
ncbi:MAG TPA: exo-alpha-sialidase [Caulobacteraceae bacterium]|nr:exo-alpha-sialidase [Caulobacteraceae bacterium]